jgi:chromate transporter
MIAVSESTPGTIGVNMATYVGFLTGMADGNVATAILGSIVATLGLVSPAIIIILIVAACLNAFKNSPYVNRAFYGLRPASAGLIAAAGLSVAFSNFFPEAGFNWKGLILAVLLWLCTNKIKKTKKLHPIMFIAASAVIGIVFSM